MQNIDILPGSAASAFRDDYLPSVESEVRVTFPPSYVDFMKRNNGGEPRQRYFPLGNNEKVVERFLSIVENYKRDPLGIYDIEVVRSQIDDRLVDGVCPFAAVFAGDFLCFDARVEKVPRIVLWDHDKAAVGAPALIPVANDFEAFLGMLRA